MLNFITNLILSKRLQFIDGRIDLLGSPIALIPPRVYVELFKELKKKNQQQVIYDSNFSSSKKWICEIKEKTKNLNSKELLDLLVKLLNLLALGDLKLISYDFNDLTFEFTFAESLTAQVFGQSTQPVDLQMAGLIAGGITGITGIQVICTELECMSLGSKTCTFSVKRLV